MNSYTEADFSKAYNKALVHELQHFFNPEEASLISFSDIKKLLKPKNESYIGIKTVPVSSIVGSEDRYKDFDREFFPKNLHLRSRWESIDEVHKKDIILPPISLYEVGGLYFVRDGNHRVSVAKSRGTEFIDAEVVSLQSEIKLKQTDSMQDIIRQIINYEKRVFYAETSFGDITDYWCLDFTAAGRYDVIYNHILTHKYYMNQGKTEEVSMEEAINSWFNNVYMPLAGSISRKKILKKFPKRTIGDLYVWTVRYWDQLKQKFGDNVEIDDAVENFTKKYRIPLYKRIKNQIKRIILRRAIDNSINENEINL